MPLLHSYSAQRIGAQLWHSPRVVIDRVLLRVLQKCAMIVGERMLWVCVVCVGVTMCGRAKVSMCACARVVSGVWCEVCGVRCVVCGVRCGSRTCESVRGR